MKELRGQRDQLGLGDFLEIFTWPIYDEFSAIQLPCYYVWCKPSSRNFLK